jgi:hypothetical protein
MKYNLIALACALLLAAGLSLTVTAGPQIDTDTDGVLDQWDNCVSVANELQGDSDLDGFGNICDADYDNNNAAGISDFTILKIEFGGTAPGYNENVDMDCNNAIGISDFTLLKVNFGTSYGPGQTVSGLACAGSPPCPASAHGCNTP